MPLVRIDLRKGTSKEFRRSVADAVHAGLVEAIDIPQADRFQILTEHDADSLIFDRSYLGIERSDACIFIQIAISTGRSVELRTAIPARIAARLAAVGVRREDVFVNLLETARENWSFGNGIAQYAQK
jgi:4-oxalocrotonate tautomerase